MLTQKKISSSNPSQFVESLLQHCKISWNEILEVVQHNQAMAIFFDVQDPTSAHAAVKILSEQLQAIHHTVHLSRGQGFDRFPGFSCFKPLVDAMANSPGTFETQVLSETDPVIYSLSRVVDTAGFDAAMQTAWWHFNPMLWGKICGETCSRLVEAILKRCDANQKTHLFFVENNFADTHFFNVIVELGKQISRIESLNVPSLWFINSNCEPESSRSLRELMHSLMRLDAPGKTVRKRLQNPTPSAIKAFVEEWGNPMQRQKSDKLALDITLAARQLYQAQAKQTEEFISAYWHQTMRAAMPGSFSEAAPPAPLELEPLPEQSEKEFNLLSLYRHCSFQEIQRTLLARDPSRATTPFERMCLAMTLWIVPQKELHTWYEFIFNETKDSSESKFVRAAFLRASIFRENFEDFSRKSAKLKLMAQSQDDPLLALLATQEMLVARILADSSMSENALTTLQHINKPSSDLAAATLQQLLHCAQAVRLGFLSTDNPQTRPLLEEIAPLARDCREFATSAPILFPLFLHACITASHLLGNAILEIDPIATLTLDLEIRSKISPATEQCLHLGNLATELAEHGLYSEAAAFTNQALTISRYAETDSYRAYARHDLINLHLQGGIISPQWRIHLGEARDILASHANTLEQWRTRALEIVLRFYEGEDVSGRVKSLQAWQTESHIEIPEELTQENPLAHLRELSLLEVDEKHVTSDSIREGDGPEQTFLSALRFEKTGRTDELERCVSHLLEILAQPRQPRTIVWAHVASVISLFEHVAAEDKRRLRSLAVEAFCTVFFRGWQDSRQRLELLNSPMSQRVLSCAEPFTADLWLPTFELVGESISECIEEKNLRFSIAVALTLITKPHSITVALRNEQTKDENKFEIGVTQIVAHSNPQHSLYRSRGKSLDVSEDSLSPLRTPEQHQYQLWAELLGKRKSHREGAMKWRYFRKNCCVYCVHTSHPLAIEISYADTAEAEKLLSEIAKNRVVSWILMCSTLSVTKIHNENRLRQVEHDATVTAQRRSAMASELSEFLGREREKLYTDLYSGNRALERLSKRLETALTTTRELFAATDRFRAVLQAAGHILRSLNWKDPCWVEVWMHESFSGKTGRFACCKISGHDELTALAEQNSIASKLHVPTIVTRVPHAFPSDSLKASALLGCSIDDNVLSIPVTHKGFGLALIQVGTMCEKDFSAEDADFVDTLTHSLAVVLANIEFLESERDALREIVALATSTLPELKHLSLDLQSIVARVSKNVPLSDVRQLDALHQRLSAITENLEGLDFMAERLQRIDRDHHSESKES